MFYDPWLSAYILKWGYQKTDWKACVPARARGLPRWLGQRRISLQCRILGQGLKCRIPSFCFFKRTLMKISLGISLLGGTESPDQFFQRYSHDLVYVCLGINFSGLLNQFPFLHLLSSFWNVAAVSFPFVPKWPGRQYLRLSLAAVQLPVFNWKFPLFLWGLPWWLRG